MDYKGYFKGKKITQLGLGLLGRGLGDAIFLAECLSADQAGGAELIVTDLKTEEELKTSVDKLKGFSNVTLHLGGHNLEDFRDRDFIMKGAGVPLDSIYIEEARNNNIPIEMDSSLFCKLLPEEVITVGVTGTRGKSTVTHLINHILKTAGKKTILGGNIRDLATLPYISEFREVEPPGFVVLELDSWQLQGFGESKISPHVSVFTTFMPDHLNYYKNDLNKYFEDKANIYKFQNENDVLVVGGELVSKIESQKAKLVIADKDLIPKDWKLHIIGDHNLLNISCAIEACKALGISEGDIKNAVESFNGIEGRLQFIKEVNLPVTDFQDKELKDGKVKIYNDNNATTPAATIAALKALGTNIILLLGGSDKNLDIKELIEEINKSCKAIIILPGSGSDKIKSDMNLSIPIVEVTNLSDMVTRGLENCNSGDVVLFSPAFTSFGLFKNEYERNDEFIKIINEIK